MSKRTKFLLGIGVIAALVFGWQVVAFGLSGSDFEIDTDANLLVDSVTPGNSDWASIPQGNNVGQENRKQDTTSGPNDESFGNGTKEDTAQPSVVDGGIPPNKSDLKFFGIYQEGNTTSGFLNMYWTRVQDPTGTTNMDFEFNKRQCTPGLNPADPDCAANGLTPLRSQGDLLITYDLTNGGTQATMSFRTWNGTATSGSWSGSTPFGTNSIGTINTSRIPLTGTSTTATDGLGDFLDPRTFGEAQIRLSSIFTDPNVCQSFGSVYLKSRSAAQFNSALKDFVPPKAVNISNCGSVHITKTDDATPGNPLEGAEFTAYTDAAPTTGQTEPGPEDDVVAGTCTTDDTGVCNIQSLLAGPYWIVETVTPTGFDTADPQHVVVTTNSEANLTFVDPAQKGAIQVTKTAKHADSNSPPNLAATFSVKQGDTVKGTIQTDGTTGIGCLGDLPQGSYTVEETDAADGYALDPDVKDVNVNSSGTCASGAVNVGFENTPLTDLSVSVDSQVDGGTASTIDCVDSADASVASGSTGANGDGSASATDLAPDTYTCTVVVDP